MSLRAARGAPPLLAELAEHTAAIERAAADCRREDLPNLLGWAARLRGILALRLEERGQTPSAAAGRPEGLLTVPEVAKLLRISEGKVYTRAKGDLKPAAVELGPGTLRFSPERIRQFIDARTG